MVTSVQGSAPGGPTISFGGGAGGQQQAKPVPRLREDLKLLPGPTDLDGGPSWTILDPARGRYYSLSPQAVALLGAWDQGMPDKVLARAMAASRLPLELADVDELARFLIANNLVAGDEPGMTGSYARQRKAAKRSAFSWLLHNYLFVRVPLVRPDMWLDGLTPLGRMMFSRGAGLTLLALVGVALYLVGRQWDVFLHTFTSFLTLEGAVWFGLAMVVAKVLHEMGHALAAKRFGCRVHSMGVALLVMMPVLYTDVSDAWRLPERHRRLIIGAAGMAVELGIAAIATILWTLMPDGPARSAVFFLAAVSWFMTLLVNLNPLMRFDGYYLLSDLIGVRNLQGRGFALARWHLRETLFGLGREPPEVLPPRTRRAVLIYAYGAWIWRFFLFLGIAVLVYHAFFKVLGILLAAVEVCWFLAMPALREIGEWWKARDEMRMNRAMARSLAVLALLIGLAFVPWQGDIGLPAMLEASASPRLHPPAPARVVEVPVAAGARVTAGQPVVVLDNPDLDRKIEMIRLELDVTQRLIQRQAASAATAAEVGVLEGRLAARLAELDGLVAERARLVVRAPQDGIFRDPPADLMPGLWVSPARVLGLVVAAEGGRIEAYVRGEDLPRLHVGARGRFVTDDPARNPLPVVVTAVSETAVDALDQPALASQNGGPIATELDHERRPVPRGAVYRVWLEPDAGDAAAAPAGQALALRGMVRIDAPAESFAASLWRRVIAVAIRESGF